MTSLPSRGGSATPVSVTTIRKTIGRVAQRVYSFPSMADAAAAGYKGESGPASSVYVVSAAELASGLFVAEGDPKSAPVYVAPAWMAVEGGYATPIVVVEGAVSSGVQTYQQRVLALGPIAYWPLSEPVGTSGAGSVKDASGNNRNGTPTAVTFGVTGIGDGNTAASFDGSTSWIDVFGVSYAAAWNGAENSVMLWAKIAAWSGSHFLTRPAYADSNNYISFSFFNTSWNIESKAGGTSKTITSATGSPAGWFHACLTFSLSNNRFRLYVNGSKVGSDVTGIGTWSGAPTQAIVGAANTTPILVANGSLAHCAIFNKELTPAQVLSLSSF